MKKIKHLSIIFPIYNESKRLKKLFFYLKNTQIKKNFLNIECIFVNDGSSDNTSNILRKFINQNNTGKIYYNLVSYSFNRGKGYAIKQGIKCCKNSWILILDCDLSVKIEQILTWEKKNYFRNNDSNVAYFGSRLIKGSQVKSNFTRILYGYFFKFFLSLIFNIKIKDTQCGFKLLNHKYAKHIFRKIRTFGYSYDIELFLLLKKAKIKVMELPVKWTNRKGSKINLIIDPFFMILEIIKIRFKI
jgi:dolichyl-phosphate beta-glucosyltransferase